jgi:hypothetical protein
MNELLNRKSTNDTRCALLHVAKRKRGWGRRKSKNSNISVQSNGRLKFFNTDY